MPYFSHITLRNWRNFEKADVDLQQRVFLVGANGSGKSNFLDAFRFLRDVVSVGGGFQEAIRRRGGVPVLRCLAARSTSDISVQVRISNGEANSTWEYDLRFNQPPKKQPLIKLERVVKNGQTIIDRPDDDDKEDKERLTQTHLEQVYANQSARELGDFFKSVRYLHVVPQLIREPDRSIGVTDDPFGGDLLQQIANFPKKTRDARLKRIKNTLKVAVPELTELELWSDHRGVPHLRGNYAHWRPKGAWLSEDQFSDGTLRLMGLLWSILDGEGPLLLEEPELSLHPGIVRGIPQMFARVQRRSGRQLLVSTHSADLLSDTGIRADETLLLRPSIEGTTVTIASDIEQVQALLHEGLSIADAVIPRTSPLNADQLPLFADAK